MLTIKPIGDVAIRIQFSSDIREEVNHQLQAFIQKIEGENVPGIIECIPTYNTVAIYYNPNLIEYRNLVQLVETMYEKPSLVQSVRPTVFEIPVLYGNDYGPDLQFVADYHNITIDEVIDEHANKEYLIFMMGFVPGFPYLGGLSENVSVPRLENPRPKVASGSVGIGGKQTGIYPVSVPSGWRIIGRTPLQLINMNKMPPTFLKSGNYIKFLPVSEKEYIEIENLVYRNQYEVKTYYK
ncbi:5-oxoprolinase subunit PxpB [Salirhabdus salicampi]|uniref:5-oxoprolinase subunit PxpB n=1 Tax=Salirhabdus salicampi TaxID=476102 RepID=UPI0020C4E1C6|nr:5-oxoprolinase subunit PxpB [Salirhabdus salicampi]